ncbi:HAD family phosphatase [Telluribacter sp.]|jgi:putative hydrolase of the HAD superfamily|uniref:HAD family hydrolase n=1 Tax=Telluribacter sp. TaxID=1978767 RepID=UPI002E151F58|nr:HAD family phosphatase [Telluribacter sp.]
MALPEKIKNIIFDLGDVIINIDVPLAARSFAQLCGQEETEVLELFKEKELFRQFETGKLDEAAFRTYVREILKQEHWDDAAINKAWNALLLDIPPARIELLQKLKERYRLFLLSNTSSIHIAEVNQILESTTGIPRLDGLFEKLFLSYEMGLMKPDPEIYHQVLLEAGIRAEETLFLDDNADNIRAAAEIGIHTIHVQKPTTILDYLKDYVA